MEKGKKMKRIVIILAAALILGAGALVALICPVRLVLVFAVIALILLGITVLRCG